MSSHQHDRRSPESFLDVARSEGRSPLSRGPSSRGRLKIFLGASPGVGKTFAMLEEAKVRQRAGVDVVVALVETHGRAETSDLLTNLEQLARSVIDYRGQQVHEMDLDALIARKPELALIDEFAHTNAPGSRHPKRWQDVMEVLDAGIDVTTTLNIQHIESLNDVVARITGVRVQETVPDEVLNKADEIELIDLPPEELINRLREGKIYVQGQVGRALENFFTKGNLTALRELAMRTAASRVDSEMLSWMKTNAVQGPWPTQERLLVCINEAPVAKALVRAGKRMADRAKIPWLVITVMTPRHEALGTDARSMTTDAMRLAETLGAETSTLHAESNAANEILNFARGRNVTRIVIGRPRSKGGWRQWFLGFLREPVSDRVMDAATDFEVTVVTPHSKLERRKIDRVLKKPPVVWRKSGTVIFESAIAAATTTVIAWPFWAILPVASIAIFYLVSVLIVSFRHGIFGALIASLGGFLAYNFFFTSPYYSFRVEQHESLVALIVFVVSAIFTGSLASRLKAQVESMRVSQKRTETLYDFARKIAAATKPDDVLWAGAYHIAATLDCSSLILMPNASGALEQVQGHPTIDDLDARADGAARWAFANNEPAGAGTTTLPMSEWLFVPLATARDPLGVIGVKFRDESRNLDADTRRLLLAVEDQVAVAIERMRFGDQLADSRVTAESDKLRAALLNSISHDLRTPLVSVIGATSALADDNTLSAADRHELTLTALDEARRLDRYVQNLLDMTRLGHGALKPKSTAVDLREIIGRVRADLSRTLADHAVVVEIPRDFPMLYVDPVLIGQALANIMENAAKYAAKKTTIRITASEQSNRAVVKVDDEGPGIPLEEREKVFDMFHRVSKGDGQPAGTGLGLAIVRGLVDAHGGNVKVGVPLDGTGTSIVMTLPLVEPSVYFDELP